MKTGWKFAIIVTAIVASLAAGLSVANWLGLDVEIAQSNLEAPIYIDLTAVLLRYNDPLQGMSGSITYRQVLQDALWWQIMDPHGSELTRMECFTIVGMLHEGRSAEISPEQYDILLNAVQRVWGPAIVAVLEAELQ